MSEFSRFALESSQYFTYSRHRMNVRWLICFDSALIRYSHHAVWRSIFSQFSSSSFLLAHRTAYKSNYPKETPNRTHQNASTNDQPQPRSRALQAKLPTHLRLCLSRVLREIYHQFTVRVPKLQDMSHTHEFSTGNAEDKSLG